MVRSTTAYTIDSIVAELKVISRDRSIPAEYREWANDGIGYVDRNPDALVEDFPANIFTYIKDTPMPDKVRDLVEGILIQEINARNGRAACNLGSLYYTGMIGEQSYKKAKEYYEIGAEEGDDQANENLGYVYYYGRDCDVDYAKAYKYFSKGAYVGRITSLYKIGDMYKNGYHVDKDENEAFRIYSLCRDKLADDTDLKDEHGGDVLVRYAECYAKGIGCEADPLFAIYWAGQAEFYFRRKEMNHEPFARQGVEWAMDIIDYCRKQLDLGTKTFE